MNWDKVKATIGQAAPYITAALSGGNPLVGMATKALCGALGLKEDAKAEDIQKMFDAGKLTSEDFAKIKVAEMEFKRLSEEAGFKHVEDILKLEVADRDSARNREIQVKDKTPAYLAYTFTAGFFITLLAVIIFGLPKDPASQNAVMLLLGALTAGTVQNVLGYYFGSSKGSDDKNRLMFGAGVEKK